jgi:hypothetical protein
MREDGAPLEAPRVYWLVCFVQPGALGKGGPDDYALYRFGRALSVYGVRDRDLFRPCEQTGRLGELTFSPSRRA